MPFRTEQPLITISGQTACMSFAGADGVSVSVSVRTPAGATTLDEDALEDLVAERVAVALRSALARVDR